MIAFPDTSFLCALYRQQSNSRLAANHFAAMTERLHVSALLLFEFRQSIRFQIFRHQQKPTVGFAQGEGTKALADLQSDLAGGAVVVAAVDWTDVLALAERLSAQHTSALVTGAWIFCTWRQRCTWARENCSVSTPTNDGWPPRKGWWSSLEMRRLTQRPDSFPKRRVATGRALYSTLRNRKRADEDYVRCWISAAAHRIPDGRCRQVGRDSVEPKLFLIIAIPSETVSGGRCSRFKRQGSPRFTPNVLGIKRRRNQGSTESRPTEVFMVVQSPRHSHLVSSIWHLASASDIRPYFSSARIFLASAT